jgi:hypothetical protein
MEESGIFDAIKADRKPREAHLKFIEELHRLGAPMPREDLLLLRDNGIIGLEDVDRAIQSARDEATFGALDRFVLNIDGYLKRCEEAGFTHEGEIKRHHWKCEDPADFKEDPEFIPFIMSHYKRFCDLKAYKKFWYYTKQAKDWVEEPDEDLEGMDKYGKRRWYRREFERISQNSMYALWKYVWYKEPDLPGGEGRYEPTLAMMFLAYLVDDGRSGKIGKGRQITSTTTITAIAIIKMITRVNYHCKLIACDLATTEEIFEDKLKYAFGRLPMWAKPIVNNDKDNMFRVVFDSSKKKGSRKSRSSKTSIVAPKLSAINGGAPDMVLVDEAPFLDIYEGMVTEGRPTLFTKIGDKLRLKRQLWAWGTGGRSAKGGGSFEKAHRALFKRWEMGEFGDGFVPIFLDWTCRPGITEEFYKSERRRVMLETDGQNADDREKAIITFRQHYPGSLDDMYTVADNTWFSNVFIVRNEEKINALPTRLQPSFGYFEPVYDMAVRNPPDSFLAHPILDSKWVPTGAESVGGWCTMFMHPRRNAVWNYFQGTDCVMSDEGLSNQASAIVDAYMKTVPCIVDMRAEDPYYGWLQSKLMGMHYRNHGQRFCHEVVERNIGVPYIKWLQGPEWRATQSLVTDFQLPDDLSTGSSEVGFDSKANRKHHLVSMGGEWTRKNGENIYISQFWSQQRYFVKKTGTTGKVTVGVSDRRAHKDDVIDAVYLAIACMKAFPSRTPSLMETGDNAKGLVSKREQWHHQFNPQTRKVELVPLPAKRVEAWKTLGAPAPEAQVR